MGQKERGSNNYTLIHRKIDGVSVPNINSRLRPTAERTDAVKLAANAGQSYGGSGVLGMGFTLTPEERDELIAKDKCNGERIFPYLGGKEVNTSPTQGFNRYVISFGDMSLEEAGQWPDLLDIVRAKVKPERDKLKNNADGRCREKWWQFAGRAPKLYAALAGKKRCLVNSRVTKHLVFAWQPTDRIFSHELYVYPVEDDRYIALLQSRLHDNWARLLSSTMGASLRYTASDSFETFPFPKADKLAALDGMGKELNDYRAALMIERDQGLTTTYNQLTDPTCDDADIVALRELHEQLDRQVLTAYGWQDLHENMPTYGQPVTDADRRKRGDLFSRAILQNCTRYENAIIDRLFELNATRGSAPTESAPNQRRDEMKKNACKDAGESWVLETNG